jgi:hypothetical protein
MPNSIYDPEADRLLSAVLSEALDVVRRSAPTPLSEARMSDARQRINRNLREAYDNGERGPSALKRVGLRDVLVFARSMGMA